MRSKLLYCKLANCVVDVPTAEGYHQVQFTDHRAEAPDDIAIDLAKSSDFYRIIRDVWQEPLTTVLIIRGGGVGDVLLTTPLVRFLAQQGIAVDYLTSPGSACLLEGNPYIREVLTARLSGWPDIQDDGTEFDLQTARDRYSAVVDLRWHPERAEMHGDVSHRVDAFYHAMGIQDIPEDRSLDFVLTDAERERARAEFVTFGPSVAYVWNSTTRNRNWTNEQHHEAIQALVDARFNVVILSETRQEVYGWVTNLSGRLTLRETAAVIDACDVTVTPDTGLFHMAQALRKPTLAYLGCFPADARATIPLTVINDTEACDRWPCRQYACAYQGTERENQCLRTDTAALVASVRESLRMSNGLSTALVAA